jgi:hypothetical protein
MSRQEELVVLVAVEERELVHLMVELVRWAALVALVAFAHTVDSSVIINRHSDQSKILHIQI